MTLLRVLAVLALALGLSSLAWSEAPPAGYAAQADFKALVTYTDQSSYPVYGMPSKLAAAKAAQAACLNANPAATAGACELVRLGNQNITTSAAIRARIPSDPHPLFLWRYRQGDATVYLAGSIHIMKPGLYPLPSQMQAAYETADYLVVEVDLNATRPEAMQFKYNQYGLLAENATLADVLSPQTLDRLTRVGNEYGLPVAQMARYKPAFITQQLALFALMAVGYDPEYGVEGFFTRQAQGKQILQLETLDFQLDLLFNQPLDVQRQFTIDTLDQMANFETLTADLVGAWLAGDDQTFIKTFEAQSGTSPESQAFMRQLMDERNVGMAEKIAGYLQTSGTYFVLIGAAHYIGDSSIIKLLERKGIRGERIFSDQAIAR